MNEIVPLIGDIMIILGVIVFATAGLGFLRFPDVYMRISAIGTAGGIGIILVVAGTLLHSPSWMNLVLVLAIIVIQLATSAVGSTAVARSAMLTGTEMKRWSYDELDEEVRLLNRPSDADETNV